MMRRFSCSTCSLGGRHQARVRRDAAPMSVSARIVGGQEATPQTFPFLLSLSELGSHVCGASLVDLQWALTAAHCVDTASPASYYSVEVYRHDLSLAASNDHACAESVQASELRCHPDYSKETFVTDICLIKLERVPRCARELRGSMPLLDPGDAAVPGVLATVAGWGALADPSYTYDAPSPDKLQFTTVNVLSNSNCSSFLARYRTKINEKMLCAMAPGRDSCQGDSGGPLFLAPTSSQAQAVQIGVVSYGIGCAQADAPGVYARVSQFSGWMADEMGPAPPAPPPAPPASPFPPALPPSPPSPPASPLPGPCACAADGISGGVITGRRGCGDHASDGSVYCYVREPAQCSSDTSSSLFPGAGYCDCTVSPSPPPVAGM
eukprot:3661754-Prymnesium_polylepis.1